MNATDIIAMDPEIRDGTPVFKGTQVPVSSLFEFLEHNHTLDEFVKRFPKVTRKMARMVLEQVSERFA